jgi:hypothetical protein
LIKEQLYGVLACPEGIEPPTHSLEEDRVPKKPSINGALKDINTGV